MPVRKAASRTAAKSESRAVVPARTTAVAAPGSWRERAKASINASKKQLAKLPVAGGNFLSFRGGVMTAGGNAIANPAPIILLAHNAERAYYSKPFDPNNTNVSPDCYSYDNEVPHEKAKVPQADACATCRLAEFGSAQNGNGKACREGSRLAFIHADVLEKGVEAIMAAPIWQARLSVLNAKTFRSYAEACFGDEAPWRCVTTLACRPDPKSQYAVSFQGSVFEGDSLLDAIAARVDEAEKLMFVPYPEFEEAPAKASTPPRRKKF